MGTPRKLPSGKWELRAYAYGKAWSETIDPCTKTFATRAQAKFEERIRAQGPARAETVRDLMERWMARGKREWSPTTYDARRIYLDTHVLPALGDRPVSEVTAVDIDSLYTDLLTKLKPASVAKVHVMFSAAFAQARKWGWVQTNPMLDVTPPKVVAPDIHPPDLETVARLMGAASPEFRAFLFLADASGARRGELCGLRWADLDFEAGEVTFRRAAIVTKTGVQLKSTKGGKPRTIALDDGVVQVLKAHRAGCVERGLALGVQVGDDTYLFENFRTRLPWRPDAVTTKFDRVRKKAKVEGVRLHDLRHGHVTALLSAGVDPRTVMGRVGHASLTTLTRYAHFVPAADRAAADVVASRRRAR